MVSISLSLSLSLSLLIPSPLSLSLSLLTPFPSLSLSLNPLSLSLYLSLSSPPSLSPHPPSLLTSSPSLSLSLMKDALSLYNTWVKWTVYILQLWTSVKDKTRWSITVNFVSFHCTCQMTQTKQCQNQCCSFTNLFFM